MSETIIEIHPLDFAELVAAMPANDRFLSYPLRDGDNVFEISDQRYHRNVAIPRTDGPHTIF